MGGNTAGKVLFYICIIGTWRVAMYRMFLVFNLKDFDMDSKLRGDYRTFASQTTRFLVWPPTHARQQREFSSVRSSAVSSSLILVLAQPSHASQELLSKAQKTLWLERDRCLSSTGRSESPNAASRTSEAVEKEPCARAWCGNQSTVQWSKQAIAVMEGISSHSSKM